MARRQTRRTVSLRAEVYVRLARYCERAGVSMSQLVERLVLTELGRVLEPEVTRADALEVIDLGREGHAARIERMREEAFGR